MKILIEEIKMYICPICKKEFEKEESIRSHYLSCWKKTHPVHKSKSAPRSKDVITRRENNDITNFFKGLNNGRNTD